MPSEFTHDVFVSYSSKDRSVVRAIAERLRADGLRVWLDDRGISPPQNSFALPAGLEHFRVLACPAEASAGRRTCPAVASARRRIRCTGASAQRRMVCLSAHAFGLDWAQLEAGTFRFRDPLNKERRFIPRPLLANAKNSPPLNPLT